MRTLPHANDDPDVLAARAYKQRYEATVHELRRDGTLSELERARRIDQAHKVLVASLNEHGNALHQRRVTYFQEVDARVKIGADIPEGTSPADKAVLMQAFMAALDRVRGMNLADLEKTFREAARFGDDTMQRAIETVTIEEGGHSHMREVIRSVNPDRVAAIEEWTTARDLVENRGIEGSFTSQAFSTPRKPAEAVQLPTLEMHEQQRQQAVTHSYVTTSGGY